MATLLWIFRIYCTGRHAHRTTKVFPNIDGDSTLREIDPKPRCRLWAPPLNSHGGSTGASLVRIGESIRLRGPAFFLYPWKSSSANMKLVRNPMVANFRRGRRWRGRRLD